MRICKSKLNWYCIADLLPFHDFLKFTATIHCDLLVTKKAPSCTLILYQLFNGTVMHAPAVVSPVTSHYDENTSVCYLRRRVQP